MHPEDHRQQQPPHFWRSRYAIGLVVIGGIAAYFLLEEHRAHILGVLPYLLLLACPLMHLFMHGGHGGLTLPSKCESHSRAHMFAVFG